MITLKVKPNPFCNSVSTEVAFSDKTLRELIAPYMDGNEFAQPTFVTVNGIPWLRKFWDLQIDDSSVVEVIPVVGVALPVAYLIVSLVILAASAAFTAYGMYKANKAMRALQAGLGQAEADPFSTVEGHSNKASLGNPVEVCYGRNRIWPSYIGRPYHTYIDDRVSTVYTSNILKKTKLTQILCIGQGDFDIHAVQIGDSLIESCSRMTYEVVPPGCKSSGVNRIMYVQPDFEAIATDNEYKELGASFSTNTFTMSPPGKGANHFEIDVEFPQDGNYTIKATLVEVDLYSGISPNEGQFNVTLNRPFAPSGVNESNTPPHRHTFSFSGVPDDSTKRYSMKVYNLSDKVLTVLELRSFIYSDIPLGYEDKTLLTVTYIVDKLSDDPTSDKVNVIATRKLKTIFQSGSIVQPTSSIPWAIYDVLTNNKYGGGLPVEFIDIDAFCEMHAELEKDRIGFNYVFNQNTTVEDAVKVIASAGRCSLTYSGSKLSLVRDDGNSTPEAMFSSENLIPNSFSWSTEMIGPSDPDSIEATYIDSDSGTSNTTTFIPEGSTGQNIQKLTLQGVSDRTQAWREAAYRMSKTQLIRDHFTFKTGMEGYIPSVGAVALLSCELSGMGVSGYVEDYDGAFFHLSRPIPIDINQSPLGRISFRRDDGSAMGPYLVLTHQDEIVNGTVKVVNIYKGVLNDLRFPMDFWRNGCEPVHFIYVQNTSLNALSTTTKIQIESVKPSDDGTVEISATNFDANVYGFDGLTPPDDEFAAIPLSLSTLKVPWIRITALTSPMAQAGCRRIGIRWGSCFGANFYKVYANVGDEVPWVCNDTYVELEIADTSTIQITVRVVDRNGIEQNGVSILTSASDDLSLVQPTTPRLTREADGIVIEWDEVVQADAYEVRLELNANSLIAYSPWVTVSNAYAKYTKAMFKIDFPNFVLTGNIALFSFDVRGIVNGKRTTSSMNSIYIQQAAAPILVTISQDPKIEMSSVYYTNYSRHRKFSWFAGDDEPGTTYHIFGQIYNSDAVGQSVLSIQPWIKIVTTDKFIFETSSPFPEVKANAEISNVWSTIVPNAVYGIGQIVELYNDNSITNQPVGKEFGNVFYIYDQTSPANGKFHYGIKAGVYQTDKLCWISDPDNFSYGKKVAIVLPHTFCYHDTHNMRIKGAIVADNGWFSKALPESTTLFDIET